MRTKNPFCSGAELSVLRAVQWSSLKDLRRRGLVAEMARKTRMSSATFGHALTSLKRSGHIDKDPEGFWCLSNTGKVLVACANQLALIRKFKVKAE